MSAEHIVVDVGNSRMKWGHCIGNKIGAVVTVAMEPPSLWQQQRQSWLGEAAAHWTVAGSQPGPRDQLAAWLEARGESVEVLRDWRDLLLPVEVDEPARVGIDRLLNAVAARSWLAEDENAVVVDAGTAVTIDQVSMGGFFGGAILPGFSLMTRSLHAYTARLPLVRLTSPMPAQPARNTEPALQTGVYWAVVGAIRALIDGYRREQPEALWRLLLTGGDAELLAPVFTEGLVWPEMTLEGIRLSRRGDQV